MYPDGPGKVTDILCIILAYSCVYAYVCDRVCVCVLRECWPMMLFGCRAHSYICDRGGIVSLHVNEAPCHSCAITARNDTNQLFIPQRHTEREQVETVT